MNEIVLNVVLILVFVLIGGYFAASELALVSVRDSQLPRLATRSRRGARVAELRADSNRFLAAVQIGVTLAGFFSAAYGGSTLTVPLAGVFQAWGLPFGLADTVALVVVTAAISYASLVLGELVPKRLALQRAEGVSLFVAPVIDRIAGLFRPVIWLLSRSTNVVVRLLGLDPAVGGEQVSEEELRDMVVVNQDLTAEERRVLTDVFGATDRQLSEVMVPRTEVEFLPVSMPLAEAAARVLRGVHSRYPVIDQGPDDVVGFVHIRDVLSAQFGDGAERTLRDILRPITLLPGSKPLLPALAQLRSDGVHIAVIADEYGGTDGIVTLEDLIEELVGEIRDEYDVVPGRGGHPGARAELDGLLHRDEVHDRAGVVLPEGPFETLGGFVQAELGHVPRRGDSVEALGRRFTVADTSGRRATRVTVTALEPDARDRDG